MTPLVSLGQFSQALSIALSIGTDLASLEEPQILNLKTSLSSIPLVLKYIVFSLQFCPQLGLSDHFRHDQEVGSRTAASRRQGIEINEHPKRSINIRSCSKRCMGFYSRLICFSDLDISIYSYGVHIGPLS